MARGLSHCDATIKQTLANNLRSDLSLADTSSLPDQFANLILEPIHKLSVSRPILIVIDTVDEAGSVSTREQFLKFLNNPEHLARIPSNIRFFIKTRPKKDIPDYFKDKAVIQCVYFSELKTKITADIYTMV
ncbi:hypothetical protein M422DRAFT_262120 [Sphaerobolus stellatus SS14]|uniref:Nephrocystin 3-like N-terminal domain-containing protein n=1 Tax=Sphaerobolus stellatus (strain SS14) TaxID=990650 RepID=A0A0C9TYJ2_SPHS4|nr:hypothetical protein M422DRAFT_262120 [Sphaerobolus stellatus SS14]